MTRHRRGLLPLLPASALLLLLLPSSSNSPTCPLLCEARPRPSIGPLSPRFRSPAVGKSPVRGVVDSPSPSSWASIPRGGAADPPSMDKSSASSDDGLPGMITDAISGLADSLGGIKSDGLILLLTTAFIPTACDALNVSPILGFLVNGLLCGPKGMGLIADAHRAEHIADLGVVLFLFEMGIHLDLETLKRMRVDVFGMGLSQFAFTTLAVALVSYALGMSAGASVVLGGGLALSSSAFVLQLLKDKDQLGTEYGRSSFGVLLLQDLAVVPLLVATPLLAGGGDMGKALASALVQACLALGTIALFGKFLLTPLFDAVSASGSQEAFLGVLLSTVLGMSFLTEGLGLSNTLGAFLAGVLLSETEHRHRVEREIAPYRGILVGLFFFTVGFEIDLKLIASRPGLVASIVAGIVVIKAAIASAVCVAFGKGLATSQRVGLVLSQAGEFAFVAFRLAREVGLIDNDETKLLLTCVSLTMAATPFLEEAGGKIAAGMEVKEIEDNKDAKGGKKSTKKTK